MIVGTGIDLVEIARVAKIIDRYPARFLERIYLPGEMQYCLRKRSSAESFAARFAAKEAAAKALGTGIQHGVGWKDIEVIREPGGRPGLLLHGRAAQIAARMRVRTMALSITHTTVYALAQVLFED
ncbi:MAG TPA: holo-ACP synthase [Acidobacteriaceae bacterium]|jgi:holo-[acyl-carrier protein] synthase|nr:holo-ACP synthase [Acidobacteriaceae bacterium]